MKFFSFKIALIITIISIAFLTAYNFLKKEEKNIETVKGNISVFESDSTSFNESVTQTQIISQEKLIEKVDDYFDIQPTEEKKGIQRGFVGNKRKLSVIQSKLESLNSDTDSITEIDNLIIEFLEDINISREEKVYGLWDIANYFDVDSKKGGYILDYLGILQPIELTDALLSTFESNISQERKMQFLNIMGASVWVDNENHTPKQLQFIEEKRIQIQKLFKEQIESSEDALLFREALLMYPSVVSAEEAIPVISNLIEQGNENISPKEMMALSTQVAFASDETQLEFLPSLLESLQSPNFSSTPINESFNEHLYGILLHEESYQFVNQDVKPNISQYLQKQEPILSIKNKDVSVHDASAYFDWVNAYSFTTSTDEYEKSKFIAEAVINSDDPIRQASILLFSNPEVFDSLKSNGNLELVEKSLRSSLKNENLSLQQKEIIKASLYDIENM